MKRAVQEGKTIVFADESGLAAQCVYGRTWGRKGETPIVKTANSKYRVSMLAAISPDGRLHWKLHEGSVSALEFIEFLEQVKQATAGNLIVVVDNSSVHTANLVRAWSKAQEGKVELEYQADVQPGSEPSGDPVGLGEESGESDAEQNEGGDEEEPESDLGTTERRQ